MVYGPIVNQKKKRIQIFLFTQNAETTQQNDILTKVLNKNSEVFDRYFEENINFGIENSVFPPDLKIATVAPIFKKKTNTSKDNATDQLASYLEYLRHKDLFITKFRLQKNFMLIRV